MRKLSTAVASIAILAIAIYYLISNINFDELESFLDWDEELDEE